MKLGKKEKSVIGVYLIVLAAFTLLFTLIRFRKTAASWIMFAFTVLAFAVSLLICALAFKKGDKLVSRLYGVPVFRIGVLYLLAQIVLSVVICAVAAFVNVPSWIAVLVSLLLLGAAAIGVFATDNARDIIEEIDSKTKAQTSFIKNLTVSAEGILARAKSDAVKAEARKVFEAARYSDPMSSPELSTEEAMITAKMVEFASSVGADDAGKVRAAADELTALIGDRNRKCKTLK